MDTSKHTPTPWHHPGMGEIHAANHDTIAQIAYHTGDDEDSQCGTDADADFIVKAVNSHQALVDACGVLAQIVYTQNGNLNNDTNKAIDMARAALAAAGAA